MAHTLPGVVDRPRVCLSRQGEGKPHSCRKEGTLVPSSCTSYLPEAQDLTQAERAALQHPHSQGGRVGNGDRSGWDGLCG